MRKLTAAQVAAMTAAVGVYATTATRYGIPVLGLAPIVAQAFDDDELEEVLVTATPYRYDIVIYPISPSSGGSSSSSGGGTPAPAPVAQVTSNANVPTHRKATRCALRYSTDLNPPGRRGQNAGFRTEFVTTGYWWGTENWSVGNVPRMTSTNAPPDSSGGWFLIDGYTSRESRVSYVYVNNNQISANAKRISLQTNLVNTVAHEWSHQYDGQNSDEARAIGQGNMAQTLYLQDGGDATAPCINAPIRNGGTGGRK